MDQTNLPCLGVPFTRFFEKQQEPNCFFDQSGILVLRLTSQMNPSMQRSKTHLFFHRQLLSYLEVHSYNILENGKRNSKCHHLPNIVGGGFHVDLFVKFYDEIFTYDKEWLRVFAEKYSKEIGIPFWCFIHAKTIDEEVVSLLKKAGCYEAEMGVQSFNPNIRKSLGRTETNDQIAHSIQLFRKYKIRIVVDKILGLPNQTSKDINRAIDFCIENKPNRLSVFWLTCYAGTVLFEHFKKTGEYSVEKVKDIEEGRNVSAPVSGGQGQNKEIIKQQTMLAILPYLPKIINRFLIKYRIYMLFPAVNNFGHIFNKIFTIPQLKYEAEGKRYYKKHIFFIKRKLISLINTRANAKHIRNEGAKH